MKKKISLNKTLFWDVNFEDLDYEKDVDFIIERVLNYGDIKDYQEIKAVYGTRRVKEIAKKVNYINKKNINFWSIIFNIPQKSFKCTKKLLTQKPNIFLKR